MSKKIETVVESVVTPIVENLGFELVDIEYTPVKGEDNELIITIDKPGGVDLDDCETVSRAIDEPLDLADPIEESYVLVVSSPGIDRVLKTDRDFDKNIGLKTDIKLYKKLDGKKEFTAVLKGYTDEALLLADETGKEISLKRDEIAQIRMQVDF